MKTFRWCLPIIVACLFLACKKEGASFTPYIQTSYFYVNPFYEGDNIVLADDTLSMTLSNGTYVLDSIDVDDKVVVMAGFGSYTNDLIAVRVNFDSTQLNMQAPVSQKVKDILLPSSNLQTIQLLLNPGYNYLAIPLNYTPRKSGVFQFSLIVESDSEFSPSTVLFTQPVR